MVRRALPLVAAAFLAGVAGAGGATRPAVLPLMGPVSELAADGGHVAILLRTRNAGCARDRVAVWAPASRTFVPIGASACTGSTSTGAGLFGVALAGTRVAYVQFAGGNRRELELRLATLARPRPVTVASAAFGLDEGFGTYIGRVAGDGALLAFDWWSECRPCVQVNPVAPRSSVWRVVTEGSACPNAGLGGMQRCEVVYARPGLLRLLAVGRGLAALRAQDGSLLVTSAAGQLRATVPFAPGRLRAARIDADGRSLVALLSSGGKNSMQVLDANGTMKATLPLPATKTAGDGTCGDPQGCRPIALRLEDLQNGLALYDIGRVVHVLRLADGHEVKIGAPGLGPVHAQLEGSGLVYSYRPAASPSRGQVAFVPMASLLSRFP